jgi:1,4-dihydroxy-2-naphthoate octaprenyltransferase
VLPLILGFVAALREGYKGTVELTLLSSFTVILIMLMTYTLAEWNDLAGDRLNQRMSPYSGGSRVLVEGVLPARVSLLLGYGCLIMAVVTGLYLYLHFQTGSWTLALGGIGIFFGYTYSAKPLWWASRGVGEVLIGFCYGWLPIATGFYLFTGFFHHSVFLLSIPVGLSIFNVILINEFNDEEADRAVGKRTLVVRFGKEKMCDFYLGVSILVGLTFIKMMLISGRMTPLLWVLSAFPVLLILWNTLLMWQGRYEDTERLDLICRNTLLVNLSITMILTLQQTLVLSRLGR